MIYYKEKEKHLRNIIAKYIKPKKTDNEVELTSLKVYKPKILQKQKKIYI